LVVPNSARQAAQHETATQLETLPNITAATAAA